MARNGLAPSTGIKLVIANYLQVIRACCFKGFLLLLLEKHRCNSELNMTTYKRQVKVCQKKHPWPVFLMLSWSQSVNKVVVKIHLPSLLLLFQLADSEVLATTFQTPPSLPANITKCRPASLRACLCLCPLVYPSTYLLAPLFIICLLSFSFFPLPAFHHRLDSQM